MSGKIIKTLSHVRFQIVRIQAEPELNPIIRHTHREQSRVVQVQPAPAPATIADQLPPCSPTRPVNPEIVALISWFHKVKDQLSREPYQLTPWQKIINPQLFYDALEIDIAAYPYGPRSHVIGNDLRNLRLTHPLLGQDN